MKTKGLGQHFLINQAVLKKIAEALDLKSGDFVVEIGAGHGELTEFLAETGAEVIAIEKDARLAEDLKKKLKIKNEKLKIIEGDILKILPELAKSYQLKAKSWKLTGNIPFYITGYLLRIIGELENKPELAILTIQKEVAERICARPPKMNLLGASVQFWAEPEIITFVSKKDFTPQPTVDAAVIKLKVKSKKLKVESKEFYGLIKILFKQPRKTIFNNLRAGFKEEKTRKALTELKIDPNLRPQNLNLNEIIELAAILSDL